MNDKSVPSIKEDFKELKENRDHEEKGEYTIIIDSEILISLEKFYMDFNIGKEIADVQVETPKSQVYMKCRGIMVFGMVFKLVGREDENGAQFFY